jgi:hypothetical protein
MTVKAYHLPGHSLQWHPFLLCAILAGYENLTYFPVNVWARRRFFQALAASTL